MDFTNFDLGGALSGATDLAGKVTGVVRTIQGKATPPGPTSSPKVPDSVPAPTGFMGWVKTHSMWLQIGAGVLVVVGLVVLVFKRK